MTFNFQASYHRDAEYNRIFIEYVAPILKIFRGSRKALGVDIVVLSVTLDMFEASVGARWNHQVVDASDELPREYVLLGRRL